MTSTAFTDGYWHCGHCGQFVTLPDDAEGVQKCPKCKKREAIWYAPIEGYREFLERQSLLKEPTPQQNKIPC